MSLTVQGLLSAKSSLSIFVGHPNYPTLFYALLAGPAPNPRIVVPGAEAQELRVTIVQAPPANPSSLQLWLVAVNTRRASSFLVAFFAVHRKHRLPQSETQSPQSRE
jgi:hypothetical protein